MLEIKKKLNNNAVLTVLNDQEVIVRGKGIGFQKKEHEWVEEDQIEKIYHLSSGDFQSRFIELIKQIPHPYFVLTDEIIEHAKEKLSIQLSDSIYVTLTDHVFMAIQRYQEGVPIDNGALWEIRKYYPAEFKIGLYALQLIKKEFDIQLPEDEAGFIALHFVNASVELAGNLNMFKITKMITDMSNIVKYTLKLQLDEESVYYFRFITHLRFFSLRIMSEHSSPSAEEHEMLEIIKSKYIEAYKPVVKIEKYLSEHFNYKISKDEQLYLLIHIEKLIRESKDKLDK
ncbi:PRD domain-containing protein [Enterococcus hulanensis]|uniref:BglG family transcription antiterminator LicT n=1 Tax=Enterococcus TaxID=1350 RepID=UPI000B5AA385|nr:MULTISPECIES: PRD domain-containing protein [Enterococcus]MBO0410354.1 PRD domain-containing protein [Enterococcus hulanensis]MDT2662723.1 PRD domain-containing protein [Enterococcus hulanensis]OTO14474.1 hypothetical protein A5875_003631 [Enterococcus sp. 3H8_DIV0648]